MASIRGEQTTNMESLCRTGQAKSRTTKFDPIHLRRPESYCDGSNADTLRWWFEVNVGSMSRWRPLQLVDEGASLCNLDLKCVTLRIHVGLNPDAMACVPTLCVLFPDEVG